MNWDGDIDVAAAKQMKPKKGRRALLSPGKSTDSDGQDEAAKTSEGIFSPEHSKKKGGWADETFKASKSKSSTNIIEQQRFQKERPVSDDDEDDIPTLPEIGEITETSPINRARTKETHQPDYIKKVFNIPGIRSDIDISILSELVPSEDFVKDKDEVWTKDQLLGVFREYCDDVVSKTN